MPRLLARIGEIRRDTSISCARCYGNWLETGEISREPAFREHVTPTISPRTTISTNSDRFGGSETTHLYRYIYTHTYVSVPLHRFRRVPRYPGIRLASRGLKYTGTRYVTPEFLPWVILSYVTHHPSYPLYCIKSRTRNPYT